MSAQELYRSNNHSQQAAKPVTRFDTSSSTTSDSSPADPRSSKSRNAGINLQNMGKDKIGFERMGESCFSWGEGV